MKISRVKNLSPMGKFLYWISERRAIYGNRFDGKPKPWTDDEVLQSQFFTNVHREDDKVTKWFRENVRDPMKDRWEVVFATICFRWFNYIPTGEILLDKGWLENWNLKAVVQRLSVEAVTNKVFTGAFNISNSGSTKPKVNRVCEDYIDPVWKERETIIGLLKSFEKLTLKGFHAYLTGYQGLGGSGFMAAQIVCDLKYTIALRNAPDWWSWCSPGPGSKRGLNVLEGKDPETPLDKDWESRITELRHKIGSKLGMALHAQDVQNCLCEYFKYTRTLKTGRSKRRYDGERHAR